MPYEPSEQADRRTELVMAAHGLHVDATTAEAVTAFAAAGIRSVLLKGPALATWLYDDGSPRSYVDADLLVGPADFERAQAILAELGYVEDLGLAPPSHARPWGRPSDNAKVDLHGSLAGASTAAPETWRVVSEQTDRLTVAWTLVEVPRLPVRALVVALHAAHHGSEGLQPLEDLDRALRVADDAIWREAVAAAEQLNAVPAFTRGLRMRPAGVALAERLGLASEALIEAARQGGVGGSLALGFERLAARRGARAKLALIWGELFPSAVFIRWWWPPARRGRLALVAGYVRRVAWLLRYARPGLRVWRRARAKH